MTGDIMTRLACFADGCFVLDSGDRMPVNRRVKSVEFVSPDEPPRWMIYFDRVMVPVAAGQLWRDVEAKMRAAELFDQRKHAGATS